MKKKLLRQFLKMSGFALFGMILQSLCFTMLMANDMHAQRTSMNDIYIELEGGEKNIKTIFKELENKTDFYFNFDEKTLKGLSVNLNPSEVSMKDALTTIASQTDLSFKRINENIFVIKPKNKLLKKAEPVIEEIIQVSIKGTITSNEDGAPLPGVSVLVKGTNNGAITDVDGKYTINARSEDVLQFSYIGFATQELLVGNQTVIDVVLQVDQEQLEEVVVIGYGTQQKKDLTGSIASVGSEEYENQPVNRLDQILQGRTAGVNVTNSSGAPGGTVSIRIRGANSINGSNEPLYVIDGFVGADFRDVNPSDIENIQILKDASATAIYGSRGANGVVLITTKSGKAGEPRLSLTARYITSTVLDTWDLMDAATFAETANARATALGTNLPFTSAEISDFRANGGTDWQDELLRTAGGQEYQLDYSGGNDKVTYFISGNYLDQEGIIINSDFKRYSLRTNLKANLTEKLGANLKMNFIRRENNNTNGNGNTSSSIAGALAWAPTTPLRDANGVLTLRDPISSIKGNPIELALNDNIEESNTFNANGGFNYEIIDGLTADVSFGISYENQQNKGFSAGSISNNPQASRRSTENIFLQNTNSLTYKKIFGDVHNFSVTGVVEHQMLQSDMFITRAVGLQFPDLRFDNITLANALTAEALKEKQTIRSYIGRVNYSFDDRYLITAAVRSDGSSKFRGNNQYGVFPSVALGWRLSEEAFMQNINFLDNLKIRGSYGITGSQAIPVFGTVTTFRTRDQDAGTSFENGQITSGVIIGNPGNPNLKWETTKQLNVGFDMEILNNRVGLTADYFTKNTTDLLLSEPLPLYSGGGNIFRNLGEVENKGFEFSLSATIIDNANFSWNSSLNASFLENEVVSIGDREQIFADSDAGAGLTNLPEMVIMPGQTLATYWGLKYLGTWKPSEASEAAEFGNVPGDSKYEDVNGDGVIGGDDYQTIGSAIPTTLLGWNNTVTYKNFTLNVFFQSMMGFDKWNFSYAQAVMPVADAREATHVDVLNRYIPGVNETSNIPAFSQSDVSEIQSSRFLEKGDFIRLKNISLTYNLPKNLIKGIDGSFMVGANNLLTITDYRGIDPEAYSNRGTGEARGADAGAYPNSKIWTFGVNVKF